MSSRSLMQKLKRVVDSFLSISRPRPHQISAGGTIRPHGRLVIVKESLNVSKAVTDQVQIGDNVIAVLRREKEITSVRIADSSRQSISANILEDGSVDYLIRGRSRQNEEGVLEVCEILIERLNQDGAKWKNPKDIGRVEAREEQGIDCQADDGEKSLSIQVIRAEIDSSVWKSLSETGETSARLPAEAAADSLFAAIEKKALRTPKHQRSQITLALDATETVGHTFGPVLKSFASRYRIRAKEFKFNEIWLVGPNVSLTSRLDE